MHTWESLKEECLKCDRCPLARTRTNIVFEAGSRQAQIIFIGEGPGENEDLKGEPFVGRAGRLLDDMLKLIGLSRSSNVYIANIVKCRPPDNRDPQPAEREACIGWLRAQIDLVNPKVLVCLGRIAAVTLIDTELKITRDHGKWYDIDGRKVMAIYHPAALLRDPHKRPDTFADLKKIEAELAIES